MNIDGRVKYANYNGWKSNGLKNKRTKKRQAERMRIIAEQREAKKIRQRIEYESQKKFDENWYS